MMQAQQASLFLGRIPSPHSGKSEILLEPAKLFIDHLEMIREKTRGNLTNEEKEILNSVLSDLEMAYVQAAHAASSSVASDASGRFRRRTGHQHRRTGCCIGGGFGQQEEVLQELRSLRQVIFAKGSAK